MAKTVKKARPTAKEAKPTAKDAKSKAKSVKPTKTPPVRPPAVPPPAPVKPKPVVTLPFDHPGKVTPPTGTPFPIAPTRGERIRTRTPRFGWISVAQATQYHVSWGTETNLNKGRSLIVNQTAATLPPEEALEPGTVYFWRVRAGNESGWGPWSPPQEFGTQEEETG